MTRTTLKFGKRHNLEEIVVINDDATMNSKAGKYAGMDRYECRKALVVGFREGRTFGKSCSAFP